MKKIFILFSVLASFLSARVTFAQSASSFHMTADTVWATPVGSGVDVNDNIVVTATDSVTILWKVIASDFPADWVGHAGGTSNGTGICDLNLCYPMYSLWPATGNMQCKYPVGSGDYHFQSSISTFSAVSAGTHYVTIRLQNQAVPTDTAYATFIITKNWPAGVGNIDHNNANIQLYPNPASNEVNLVYEGLSDVKTIAVYNLIGKVMSVYRVNGTSANLDLENVPSGIYFARLMNAQGDVLATRKFAKQ